MVIVVPSDRSPHLIPFEKIIPYRDAGIIVRPLNSNGDPDVSNLFTEAELVELTNTLTDTQLRYVYDNPVNKTGLRILKLLNLQDPRLFLTDEKIRLQTWYGVGLATGLTAIPAQSDPSKVLFIVAFDIDNN